MDDDNPLQIPAVFDQGAGLTPQLCIMGWACWSMTWENLFLEKYLVFPEPCSPGLHADKLAMASISCS